MKIHVKRFKQGKHSTLSEIYLGDDLFCYGLEDTVRDVKIKGSTAIPVGAYKLGVNKYGGMNARYKRKYPDLHQGMIELQDVPDFKYVYIHIGNYFSDTAGCLLVGDYFTFEDGDFAVFSSAIAYQRLYETIIDEVSAGKVELFIS